MITKEIQNGCLIALCLMASRKKNISYCGKYNKEFRYNKKKQFSFATTLFHTMLGISREFNPA